MRHTLVSILAMFIFLSADCRKEGSDCHYNIIINNNSPQAVILGLKQFNPQGLCILEGTDIPSGQQFEYRPFNFCIENSISDQDSIVFFIVDPSNFNLPNLPYDCDSIEIKTRY